MVLSKIFPAHFAYLNLLTGREYEESGARSQGAKLLDSGSG